LGERAPVQVQPYLSIVLPCHNEAANIGQVLERLCTIAGRMGVPYEVIVVDDGSRDGTSQAAGEAGKGLGLCLRVLRHGRNEGYGAAVRTGIAGAEGRYIFLTDGDGQFDLGELPEAMRLLGRFEAVLGYRKARQDPPLRRWFGACWTLLINLCLQVCIRDMDCAFKLINAQLLKRADLNSRGALISPEIIASLAGAGARIVQRPVRHLPRRSGQPTGGSPRVVGRAFVELARSLRRLRRIRFGCPAGQTAHTPGHVTTAAAT
jgi:glycosyltransferase involved in cell wall biosynthesis